MSLVSSKNKKVFLSTNTKIDSTQKVDIIISPELYWVRIFDIPVKNPSQARHVLPTLFEDILHNVTELSYQVIKLEDNKYLCFAYVNKTIYEAIKKSGISLSLVDGIYFAQNECKSLENFTHDNKSFLYTSDNILIKVPNSILINNVDLHTKINSFSLSSNKVDIKLYNNVLSSNQIYTILSIILIISVINFYKLFDYNNQAKNIDNQILKQRDSSSLPSSLLQANAILKKYENQAKKEFRKREFMEYILKNNKLKFTKIKIDTNMAYISFSSANKRSIDKYISKKYKILSSRVKALSLEVKLKL